VITIIVPVYAGLADTQRCLESVARHAGSTRAPFGVLIIDDGSPDTALVRWIEAFATDTTAFDVEVLHNERNLGFVKTCNRGLRATSGDVVILNADTVVTKGWLDSLAGAVEEPGIATVTPLTNFGSICTVPESIADAFALDGDRPRIDECAAFVTRHSPARRPQVICGVGFCMLLTRAAIDAVGVFDDAEFGAGYGEEVDFCLRATAAGLRHVVDDSTFVYHRGAVSFGDRRKDLLRSSSELIHQRYPSFRAMNLRERAADPLKVSFASLELGLTDRRPERPHVLQILHSKPGELGGTEKHVWQLVDALAGEFDISVFQPAESGYLLTTLWNRGTGSMARHEFHIPGGEAKHDTVDDPAAAVALQTVLDMFDFDAVHIQNIVHHSLAPLAVLADFDGPVCCSVRDLYLACPHHWLLYRNTQSCGIPDDLSYCAVCLPETRGLDVDYLQAFRRTVAERLDTVDHWVFATQSAVDFFRRVYDVDPARIALIQHGTLIDDDRSVRRIDETRVFGEPLRVGYVGIGWSKKGLPEVNELAEKLVGTGVEIHHFGELREPISPHIHAHGVYDNAVLPELLDRAGIQVVLLPGQFVETFGHVLTEALVAGRPAIGSRWGALGERIRRHQVGWTIDPEDVDGMRQLIENLDGCRPELLRATQRAVEVDLRSVSATAERYAELYRTGGKEPVTTAVEGDMADTTRLQRELRALANVNRQLQVQVTELEEQLAQAKARGRPPTSAASRVTAPPRGLSRRVGSQAKRVRNAVDRLGVVGAGRAAARRSVATLRQRAR
jgi:GT2 family glycosyltransferase/glycosyltransferase involved in cell wall biosynthesis